MREKLTLQPGYSKRRVVRPSKTDTVARLNGYERCFEDQKSEIGLDQYEGRRYQGLKRHLILSCVSSLFLSRMREEFGGEKSGVDGVPGAHGGRGLDPELVAGATSIEEVAG